jgi:predicted helicase
MNDKEVYSVSDIFPVYSVGIVTARDRLTICRTREEMYDLVKRFAAVDEDLARKTFSLRKDTRDWQVSAAQKDVRSSGTDSKKIVPILYRPFDVRWTYYTGKSRGFMAMPRPDIMTHMLKENIALISVRKTADAIECFLADTIADSRVITAKNGISYLFPLYLYARAGKKKVNIDGEFFFQLNRMLRTKEPVEPEQILYYIYAMLFSNRYRLHYVPVLKLDFPRIPFPTEKSRFVRFAGLGKQLANLHLLRLPEVRKNVSRFHCHSDEPVQYVNYVPESYKSNTGKVYINDKDYLPNILKAVWRYRLCGYQVLNKLIKGYKGRRLTLYDAVHISNVVTALQQTIEIQQIIDELYSECFG